MTGRSPTAPIVAALPALFARLAILFALATSATAADDAALLRDLTGTYLGRATVKDLPSGRTEEREIDVEIGTLRSGGFRLRWVNVTLVNGRRDLPGVKRRVSEVSFTRASGQSFFVESQESSVFTEREEVTPLGGDAIRWAVLDPAGLHVYAFIVLDDGRYELQTYSRRRTAEGLALHYERVVDGELLRTIDGAAVKVE